MLNSEGNDFKEELQGLDRLPKWCATKHEISCDSASWYPKRKTGSDLDTPKKEIE